MNLILKAAALATDAHKNQKRKWTGRPYIEHPGRVAARVSTLRDVSENEVAAAWLHDVPEDQPAFTQLMVGEMPEDVCSLVGELTNTKHHPGVDRRSRKNADRERLRTVGRWAKITKLVDRIDNLRDMDGADSGFKSLYLQESLLLANVLLDYTDPVNLRLYLELMVEIAQRTH
jgi:(p)ppGpp synthase/HD superfamily hydrolase